MGRVEGKSPKGFEDEVSATAATRSPARLLPNSQEMVA
jgi:hypothetical protein